MKVCLITAPTVTDFKAPEELRSAQVRRRSLDPPLGILSLAAVLESTGLTPRIIDLNVEYWAYIEHEQRPDTSFAAYAASRIAAQECDLYGFGSICATYPLSIRIAGFLKTLLPCATILFGGPQASVVDVDTLREFPFMDLILRGEAENSLLTLLDHLAGLLPVEDVPGLTYRRCGQVYRTPVAPVIENLDDLPPPAYHLTHYLEKSDWAALELGRGCPFACTFCSTNDFFRRRFRLRSPEAVLRDMQNLYARYGVLRFELVHDMFTVDRKRVVGFCDYLLHAKSGFEWSCSARTDCVDRELLLLMKEAGCVGVFYGVESGSERMQRSFQKHLDVDRAKSIVRITDEIGISCTVSLISGFPDETWNDVQCTADVFIDAARRSHAKPQINLLAPLAGTPLFTSHRHELLLADAISDMSSQGIFQDEEDAILIQGLPSVFPNFYRIPTPHLDQRLLFEFNQFLMTGVQRFRWLLVALADVDSQIVEFYFAWQRHRIRARGELSPAQIRAYYRRSDFQMEFLDFIKSDPAYASHAVKHLTDVQVAIDKQAARTDASANILPDTEELCATDIPFLVRGLVVLETACDLDMLIQGLAQAVPMEAVFDDGYYLVDVTSRSKAFVNRISPCIALLLRACDGQLNSKAIMSDWWPSVSGACTSPSPEAFFGPLQELRAQGLVCIHRNQH